ncbi:pyridoxamine 5'-phosphate oxidase family protein [Nocardioides sp. BP30]|uniref:pyridoxamine 5'-phosphate oxidase family protein n=1 Tax=Nocardioides sp. BP30 TaxID=3036374 RepID=UPI0024687360|nr:pyridoxamine 5'-phosphate oxidase family protein [Nocardioides sp. BP30]WGL50988.1 pyridoxamine 5'-phosphate oxidase family protein [Nocardioides sp. BP30]
MSDDDQQKLIGLMKDMPIAMLTTYGPDGPHSIPMARQEVDPGAEMWFITARHTRHVEDLATSAAVSLTFSSSSAWVAMTGRAELVEDQAKLEELWNSFAEAWMPAGPEDPNAALLRVEVEHAEYWDTPGGRIASAISFAKAKLTGNTYDAEHGTVEPS